MDSSLVSQSPGGISQKQKKLAQCVNLLEIVFDANPPIFQESEQVTGSVLLHVVDYNLKYKGIFAEISGNAVVFHECEHDEQSPSKTRRATTEQYFLKTLDLAETDTVVTKTKGLLEPGIYRFPFNFKLPPELPSSFEGQYGLIRYAASARIERIWSKDIEVEQGFAIVSGLNLNFIPEAATKIEICKYKQLGSCCSKGSVIIDWTVKKSGYIPGDCIWIHGAVQNDSTETVSYSKATLSMIVEYKSKKVKHKETKILSTVDKGETAPNDITVWQDTLFVPPTPPTGIAHSSIIDVRYELEFKAEIDGGYSPIVFKKDIYVGTVPLSMKEMKSCVAGMYNQPYDASIECIISGSQASLTQIIAQASAAEPTTNPTAPSLSSLDFENNFPKDLLLERPPPFAPHVMEQQPIDVVAPTASAPTETTLMRPWSGE